MKNINRTLKNKNFVLIWFAQIFSALGIWTYYVTISTTFYNLTQTSTAIIKFRSIETVVLLILSPIIGVIVDKLNKKYLIIFSDLIRVIFLIAIIIFEASYILYLCAISISIAEALSGTSKVSFLPEIVCSEELITANSIRTTTSNIMLIFGGILGGLIIGTGGYKLAFSINIITFIISAILQFYIKYSIYNEEKAVHNNSISKNIKSSFYKIYKDIVFSLKYLRSEKEIIVIIVMFVLLSVGAGSINVLSIVYANQILDIGSSGYGYLLTSQGIGALVSAISLAFFNRYFKTINMFCIGFFLMGLSMSILAFTSSFIIAAVLFFITGFGNSIFLVTSTSILQKVIAPNLRGRIFSLQELAAQSSLLLGMQLTRLAEKIIEIQWIIMLGGLFQLFGAFIATYYFIFKRLEKSPVFE